MSLGCRRAMLLLTIPFTMTLLTGCDATMMSLLQQILPQLAQRLLGQALSGQPGAPAQAAGQPAATTPAPGAPAAPVPAATQPGVAPVPLAPTSDGSAPRVAAQGVAVLGQSQ